MDYRLRAVTDKYDLTVDEQKVEFLKEASELWRACQARWAAGIRHARGVHGGGDARVVTDEAERRRKKR